jgi:MFS family permease
MQRPQRRMARRRRPKGRMERILISSDFALLWLKQSVTALCDALFSATLIIWLGVRTNSPLAVGLALVALGLPYALFSPFAEAAADRWSRRRTMFVTDVVRGLLTFLLCITVLPAFTPRRALAIIYLLCFFIGLMNRFSFAAQRSAITAVVRPSEHPHGIVRIQGSAAIMSIVGPILAAMLFLMLGPSPIPGLILAGFLLLLSAGGAQAMDHQFTAKVRAVRARRKRRSENPDGEAEQEMTEAAEEAEEEPWTRSVWRSGLADGLKGIPLVLRQRPFGTLASVVALVAFVGGIFNVLEVFFVSAYLGYPGAYFGLLVSANAAGFLLGSVWFRRLDAHLTPITTFIYAVLGMGLTTAGFISSRDLGIAILWAATMGVANGLMMFAAQTALVETGERDILPRLFVGYETLTALLGVIGIFVGSVAASADSIGMVLGIDCGVLILGGVAAWLVLSGRAARFKYRKAAAQNKDPQDEDVESLDEMPQDYEPGEGEPAEDEAAQFDEMDEQPEDAPPMYRPSRQFNRPWAAEEDGQSGAGYEEGEEPQYEEEDEHQWEPAAPIEEPPAPRPSLRLRPAPWEQPGGPGRRR